jgi:hypothetical protein
MGSVLRHNTDDVKKKVQDMGETTRSPPYILLIRGEEAVKRL